MSDPNIKALINWLCKLENERDEARREICEFRSNVSTPVQYAAERGWSYLYETEQEKESE